MAVCILSLVSQVAVSVLMPVAPRARWLGAALVGLRAQRFTDWELVIVLDGACDANECAIAESGLQIPLRVLRTEGGYGVARSLNLGLTDCRGPLIARHDADDVSAPERIALQAATMLDRPQLLVLGTSARLIDETGQVIGRREVPSGGDVVRRLLWRNALIHPSVMMRRSAVTDVGGYDEASPRTEDYELWLRLAARGPLDNLQRDLVDYRIHGQQHSGAGSLGGGARKIRLARREAVRSRGGTRLGSDFRHAAWASVQIARGRGL